MQITINKMILAAAVFLAASFAFTGKTVHLVE